MHCGQCGAEVTNEAKFCQACGAKIVSKTNTAALTGSALQSTSDDGSAAQSDLVGVKGWLLLLCVSLTVGVPLMAVWRLVEGWVILSQLVAQTPSHVIRNLQHLYWVDAAGFLPAAALGTYAGFALWTIRPNAVRWAKLYLIAYFALCILSPFWLEAASELPREMHNAMTTDLASQSARGLVASGIWFAYLHLSKRVRATYSQSTKVNSA